MAVHPSWRLLPVTASDIPTLLVSASFAADSYSVHLTDLVNVWEETMERKPIVKRGLVEDTSIDPSDSPDQLRRMLELIRAAFDPADEEHVNTSMKIGSEKDGALLIHVTCVLPKPLEPFRWPMQLAKLPPAALATKLVLPMVMAHEARVREADHLMAALREKDAVINKLVDKLDTTGIGLEQVFNILPGKRKTSRSAAEERVKGLAPFREADLQTKSAEFQAIDVPTLLGRVFGGSGMGSSPSLDLDLEASGLLNDWWTKLGKGRNIVLADRPKEGRRLASPASATAKTEVPKDDDDDFQVQATPPGLSAARKRDTNTKRPPVDDEETSDGEDSSDIPDGVPPLPTGGAGPSRPRLGALGGRKRPSPSPSPPRTRASPPRPARTKQPVADPDSETASEGDDEDLDAPARVPSPPKPPPRRGGLGRIGGRPRATTPVAERAASPDPPNNPSPRKHKLGVIGAAPKAESSARSESLGEERKAREGTKTSPKRPPPRETSLERADRKRAELQRELEKKAAAGPVKKKRKF
ncbi:XRCC4-like factor-domain-containing protein [Podospora conica]|nr:XRCC4-like factor-domain-containing protein [Schizothecium conicum]